MPPPSTTLTSVLSVFSSRRARVVPRRTVSKSVGQPEANCVMDPAGPEPHLYHQLLTCVSSLPPCPLCDRLRRSQALVPAQVNSYHGVTGSNDDGMATYTSKRYLEPERGNAIQYGRMFPRTNAHLLGVKSSRGFSDVGSLCTIRSYA